MPSPGASGTSPASSGMDGTARREPVKTAERRGQRKRREDEKAEEVPEDVSELAALLGKSAEALTVKPQHSDRKVLENFEKQASGVGPAVSGSKRATPRTHAAALSGGREAVGPAGSGVKPGIRNKGKGSMEGSGQRASLKNLSASQLAKIPRLVPTWSDEPEDIIYLVEEETTVGRGADNTKTYADKMMSKKHAAFTFDGEKVTVRDMGSKNGIYVNSRRVPEQVLDVGDKVVVGSRHFKLEMPKAKAANKTRSPEKKADEPREKTRNTEREKEKEKESEKKEERPSGMKEGEKVSGMKKIAYDDRVSLSPAEARIKILKLYFGISIFAFAALLLVFLIVLFIFKAPSS